MERPHHEPNIGVSFQHNAFDAKIFVRLQDVTFSYPNYKVFEHIHLEVRRGDRIGIVGPNGVGKSTLLGLVTGQLTPEAGSVIHHPQAKIGYFAQELNHLNNAQTVLDSVLALPEMSEAYARTILASFLFRKEDVLKPISSLSMGERCRVAFVNLYFSNANLLVLDEPTNYLDIDTRERLEEALLAYPGALMIVSHDRYLLRKLVNRVVYFEEKTVRSFDGTMEAFVSQMHSRKADLHVQSEIDKLELSLTQLMSVEADDAQANDALMMQIRAIRARLNDLRSGH
ncbi:ATP-binding cassette domain-containing protein [Alicyclobacillus acidoterrestris]|uniref:ATP-binding cassette domain-containing protein n=1 Tax=Alicyclobacillus acidoterrestris (strain ATCC 49025 / DSM 3922 / CIP 106132 / NCIMB 13137 / GD3B) TaxID=1356854 RepID=T0BAG0_ALIAG|nr:ATP-binding cassette domain-containing protein [Alicyclobacillus acidoterrestris]EPZ41008.1 hypothetical protein N007_17435 [Alicyclobacillus acidoterrestris ATCC 49025]UNO47827.1 ATP-binding cassette domain-containing protein [Alicyclobacillus acidoterrestris]